MSSTDFSNQTLFACNGLVAVVTGGGSGLGATMALALAHNGATVFILGRRLPNLLSISQEAAPGTIIPIECDCTDKSSLTSATAQIASQTGFINLLCVNHGIVGPKNTDLAAKEGKPAPSIAEVQEALWRTSVEDFSRTSEVNVGSVYFTTVAFLGLLDEGNRRGNVRTTSQVVVTGAIGGFYRTFTINGLAYITSKAAVMHMAKSLAAFLIDYRIRVNVIAPGVFPSEMSGGLLGKGDITQEGSLPANMQPMTRAGREEEMAGTILYLASEAGGYCSGSVQVVDGGRLGVCVGATY